MDIPTKDTHHELLVALPEQRVGAAAAVGIRHGQQRRERAEGVRRRAHDGARGGLRGGEDEGALEDEAGEEPLALLRVDPERGEEGEAASEGDAEDEEREVREAGAGVAEERDLGGDRGRAGAGGRGAGWRSLRKCV